MRGNSGGATIRAWLVIAIATLILQPLGQAQIIYSTGFEPGEGYELKYTLAGQGGWLAEGTGGNGLVENNFENLGNQAYIGFFPPEKEDEGYVNLWRPIDIPENEANRIRFSVIMMIADMDKEQRDEFRWSIYNSETKRLASIDFDNHSREINYELDDGKGFQVTEFGFERNAVYELSIDMDFKDNHWSAFIGGETMLEKQPLTTTGAKLDLGDISAVWVIREIGKPGDNYMVFDNYKIEQLKEDKEMPWRGENLSLEMKNGLPVITLGPGKCVLEASANLKHWETLATSPETTKHTDNDFPNHPKRFYRLQKID